jgi:26S proteasome regulatory subunit N11
MQRMLSAMGMGAGNGAPAPDSALPDTSETITVSPLALLKMLKHARAGIPMEVVGLMLGHFVNDYQIVLTDVFSMPQRGNTVSIEDIDPVYQTKMLSMLAQVGRPEAVIGWYHSHPGFGCWFSGTDMNTQQSFEQLNSKAVGIVVDPIQSVKGKVVIDCFRLMNPQLAMTGAEPRQITSNIGHLTKPSITALIHGLNRHYYSINIDFKKTQMESEILQKIENQSWIKNLKSEDTFVKTLHANKTCLKSLKQFTQSYVTSVKEELEFVNNEQGLLIKRAGKMDAKKAIEKLSNEIYTRNTLTGLNLELHQAIFIKAN